MESSCRPLLSPSLPLLRTGHVPDAPDQPPHDDPWQLWARPETPCTDEKRDEALRKIRECAQLQCDTLNLSGLGLTSLPPLPLPAVTTLILSFNRFTTVPTELPPALEILNIGDNLLQQCQGPLPEHLRHLDLSHNYLMTLAPLPAGLTRLDAAHNQLQALPPLPPRLCELNLCGNSLRTLPSDLPRHLLRLDVSSNGLTSVPDDLPSQLAELDIRHNFLTSVPPAILRLPRWAVVRMENNAVSAYLRPPVLAHEFPNIYLTAPPAGEAPIAPRPLWQAVERWLVGARRPLSRTRWQQLGGERHAGQFSAFLDALYKSRHQDHGTFTKLVGHWLEQLAALPDLRAETFAIAQSATESCEDRVALTYNQMQHAWLAHRVQVGKLDHDLPKVVALGRELFRLEHLGHIAREKMAGLNDADDIEVMLVYQVKLRAALGLRHGVDQMRFYAASGVNQQNLKQAERRVKLAENQTFRRWLLAWTPWKSVLQRLAPDKAKRAEQALQNQVDDGEFDRRVAQRLVADQLHQAPDAHVRIGRRVMGDMQADNDEALALDVLGADECQRLLAPYWPSGDIPDAPDSNESPQR